MKFSCFSGGEIPSNHGHRRNLKRNRLKLLHLGPRELSGPKMALIPNPLFSDGNWKFGRCQSEDIFQAAKLAKFQIRPTPASKVMGIGILGPKKGAVPKIHYASPINPNFIGGCCSCGESNSILKIFGKKNFSTGRRLVWPNTRSKQTNIVYYTLLFYINNAFFRSASVLLTFWLISAWFVA